MSKYNKGDKFIIELDEQVGNLWRVKGFSTLVFDDFGLDRLGQLVQGVDQFNYNKGADDAWELVRKLIEMEHEDILKDAFECEFTSAYGVLGWLTYKAAAEKVEAWNKEKKLRVGDVVKLKKSGHEGIVTKIFGTCATGVTEEGNMFTCYKYNCTKTDRHIDIEAVLAQIE